MMDQVDQFCVVMITGGQFSVIALMSAMSKGLAVLTLIRQDTQEMRGVMQYAPLTAKESIEGDIEELDVYIRTHRVEKNIRNVSVIIGLL